MGRGRPFVDDKRIIQYPLKMNSDEAQLLRDLSDRLGVKRSKVLIMSMQALKEKLDAEEDV